MPSPLIRRGGQGRRYRPLAEINVTPLVDVMLVLLVIFMVTAPLMSTAVNIDLPKISATPVTQDSEPLNVSVNQAGAVYLQDQPVELGDLVTKLQAIAKDQKDRRIFVRGDKGNSYGHMLEVMSTIIQGGFTKVSLLTDPNGASPPTPSTPSAPGAVSPAAAQPAATGAPASSPASSSSPTAAGPRAGAGARSPAGAVPSPAAAPGPRQGRG